MHIHHENTRRRCMDITSNTSSLFTFLFNHWKMHWTMLLYSSSSNCNSISSNYWNELTQANEAFNTVLSSGRDRRVWITDLRNPDQRTLLCEASAPVLRLCVSPDMENVWVATTESSIKRYVSIHSHSHIPIAIHYHYCSLNAISCQTLVYNWIELIFTIELVLKIDKLVLVTYHYSSRFLDSGLGTVK